MTCVLPGVGQVYIMGGSEPQDPEQSVRDPQPDFLIYDVETESWSTGPSLPGGRMECTAAAVGGRVWVMCGSLLDPQAPALDSMLSWAPGTSPAQSVLDHASAGMVLDVLCAIIRLIDQAPGCLGYLLTDCSL
jgi:hypothetical protein